MVMPIDGADSEKVHRLSEFGTKVRRVLNEPDYLRSAQRLAESIRKFGGAREAADRIEQFAASRT
jgi:UDP:flavonoid glycosyltransferase YjiC (YdhE family)